MATQDTEIMNGCDRVTAQDSEENEWLRVLAANDDVLAVLFFSR